MRLITFLDIVRFDDGRPPIKAHYHILTRLSVVTTVKYYARRMEGRSANFAAQGKQRSFVVVSVAEEAGSSALDVQELQSPHFTGFVLTNDFREVEFENYDPRQMYAPEPR